MDNVFHAEFQVYLMALPTLTAGQTIHSTLTVTPTDTNPSNNTAAADTVVVTRADVDCAISLGQNKIGPIYPGDVLQAVFEAANVGPDPANDVVMDVTLPPGVIVKSESWNHGSCTTTAPFQCTAATLEKSDLTGKQILILTLNIVAPSPGTYPYGCSATWSNPNYASVPSAISSQFTVDPPPPTADLSLFVEATPKSVIVGDLVTYMIHITNAGNTAAANVSMQQSSSRVASFSSASVHCSGASDVSCLLGTLESGAWTTVTVTDRVTEPGTLTSAFTVATASPEGHTSNNTAVATVEVSAPKARRRAARH